MTRKGVLRSEIVDLAHASSTLAGVLDRPSFGVVAPLALGSLCVFGVLSLTACPKDGSLDPNRAAVAMQQAAAVNAGKDLRWREAPVLEGDTHVTIGEVSLDALAVATDELAALILVEAGEDEEGKGRTWIELPTSFEVCTKVEVELVEIEGLEGSGVLMTQLLCDRVGIPFERLSSTSLIRLDPEHQRAELLWQGEGWFINNQDICQAYEVYSFRASHDGARVEILLDREVIFDASRGGAVECEPEAFGQESIEIVHLLRPEASKGS